MFIILLDCNHRIVIMASFFLHKHNDLLYQNKYQYDPLSMYEGSMTLHNGNILTQPHTHKVYVTCTLSHLME